MRLDPEHVEKLARARDEDSIKICPRRMRLMTENLNCWEEGLLAQVLMKAASARRLSREQRVLLALVAYTGEEDEQ